MKAIKFDVVFKLPDDFTGDVNDAIEAIAKYRRIENKTYDAEFDPKPDVSLYENWWEMIHSTNRKLLGETWLGELTEDGKDWKITDNIE